MSETTQLATLQSSAMAPREAAMPQVKTGFFDLQSFELTQRVAKAFAASSLVPKEYQGDVANCMIALNMAQRIGADPMMVMQSLVIVHGRPTWAAQFLIATANACGRFSALRFEFFGTKGQDDWGCRAFAIEKETGEKLVGSDVTIAIAKSEGWANKNGSKWKTMPQQMLMYRAGSWWVRAYAPEISMGLTTQEEAVDVIDITPSNTIGDLRAARVEQQQTVALPAAELEQQAGAVGVTINVADGVDAAEVVEKVAASMTQQQAGAVDHTASETKQRDLSDEDRDFMRSTPAEDAAWEAGSGEQGALIPPAEQVDTGTQTIQQPAGRRSAREQINAQTPQPQDDAPTSPGGRRLVPRGQMKTD